MQENGNNKSTRLSLLVWLLIIMLIITQIALYQYVRRIDHHAQTIESNLTLTEGNVGNLSQNATLLTEAINNLNQSTATKMQIGALLVMWHLQLAQTFLMQGKPVAQIEAPLNQAMTLLTSLGGAAAPLVSSLNALTIKVSALNKAEVTTTLALLDQLQANLAQLSFNKPIMPDNSPTFTSPQNWWQRLVAKLKGLVVVRTGNQISTELIGETERFDALRELTLLIQEAQWQVLTNQDPSATLNHLAQQVENYTDNNSAQSAYLATLATLQHTPLIYPADDLSAIEKNFAELNTRLTRLSASRHP